MAAGLPPQHYLPVYAPSKINKLMTKLAFKLRPGKGNTMRRVGGSKKSAPKSKK